MKRRGRQLRRPNTVSTVTPLSKPKRVYHTVRDLITMMDAYRAQSNGRFRGLFEDCKADIYRLFAVDYNDKQIDEIRPTGCSDRVFNEWRARFEREFGELAA